MNKRFLIIGFTVFVFVYAIFSVFRIVMSSAPDFQIYYAATRTSSFSTVSHMLPPPSVVAYMPIGIFPYAISQALWVILSLVLLPLSVYLMLGIFGMRSPLALLFVTDLAFLSFPTRFTLGLGQVNIISLFLVVSALYLESKGCSIISGILFALTILLKPELFLLLLIFFLFKRLRFLYGSIGTLGAFSIAALLLWGPKAFQNYGSHMGSSLGILSGRSVYYNQSLSGFISRIGSTPAFTDIYLGLTVIILFLFIWYASRKRVKFPGIFWLSIPLFLILEPIAWQHHLIFLLPTYLWVWKRIQGTKNYFWYMIVGVSYILVSVNIKEPNHITFLAPIILSHGLWGTILLLFAGLSVL